MNYSNANSTNLFGDQDKNLFNSSLAQQDGIGNNSQSDNSKSDNSKSSNLSADTSSADRFKNATLQSSALNNPQNDVLQSNVFNNSQKGALTLQYNKLNGNTNNMQSSNLNNMQFGNLNSSLNTNLNSIQIKCPNCGELIEPSQAFRHEFEDKLKQEFEQKFSEQKKLLEQRLVKEIEQRSSLELEDMRLQLKSKDDQVAQLRQQELRLREENRKVEEAKKNIELDVQRKLDQERRLIEQKAIQQVQEEYRYKVDEKDKIINDLNKSLEEAKRKAQQGSQQLQGEVLELDFEQKLKETFIDDKILPVEKGVKGADVRQVVVNKAGQECGAILWETKRTKNWTEGWVEKLKSDLRNAKANVAVIVTTTLPLDVKEPITLRNGVYVTTFATAVPLAILLRKNLIDIAYQKLVSAHRGEKADHLYEYITGHTFKQQLEAMVDSYFNLKNQITKERIAYEKMWKERESQVDKLLLSTANIVGSIQGEVGSNVLQVKGLEIFELEEPKQDLKAS